MTNADLEEVADEVLDVPDDQLDDYRGSPNPVYVKPRIVAAIRAAVLKAYEEAAKVTCEYCARELSAELVSTAECPPLAEVGSPDSEDLAIYIHRRDDQALFSNFLCAAGSIHMLKDSLTEDTGAGRLFLNIPVPAIGQSLDIPADTQD